MPPAARLGYDEPLSARRQRQLLWALLAVGVLARAIRFLLRFPLWEDESALAYNLLDRGYLDLLLPLDHEQVCPVGFLWMQLTLVRCFGFSEYVLRLPAFACGIAGLFLFRHLAGRLLRGTPLVLAVGFFAVAYPAIRYAAEAKPYGCDAFCALVLLTVAVEWWQRDFDRRWLWLLAALMPLVVLFSYPVVFIAGGTSLTVGCLLWRAERQNRGLAPSPHESSFAESDRGDGACPLFPSWIAWIACNLALAGSLASVYFLFVREQSASELASMRIYWSDAFPPLGAPSQLPGWLLDAHTGVMLAYPVGGMNRGSTFTFVCCAAAVVVLWRRRQIALLLLCLTPLGLTLAAAALGRYPYGGMVRFQLYMAPIFCLLAGFGLAVLLAWCPGPKSWRPAGPIIASLVLTTIAAASIGRDCWRPAKGEGDVKFREFAQWLWRDLAGDGEMACLHRDLHRTFSPSTFERRPSSLYFCNQRICSPRHAGGEAPRWDRVAADWPLRCVEFVSATEPYDLAARREWLKTMAARYELVGRDSYALGDYDSQRKQHVVTSYVAVYTFVPKRGNNAKTDEEERVAHGFPSSPKSTSIGLKPMWTSSSVQRYL